MTRTRTDIQRSNDYEAICGVIKALNGGLKEPELEAATGIDERRVMLAVRWARKLGYLEVNAIGEVVISGWRPRTAAEQVQEQLADQAKREFEEALS